MFNYGSRNSAFVATTMAAAAAVTQHGHGHGHFQLDPQVYKQRFEHDVGTFHANLVQNEGMLVICPAQPNVIQLLEDFVKNIGLRLVNDWHFKTKQEPLDLRMETLRMTTLAERRLCEQILELTNPYSSEIMNQPLPATLAEVYEQLIRAQSTAAEFRDLFDAVCGSLLVFPQERVQFEKLKPFRKEFLDREHELVPREQSKPKGKKGKKQLAEPPLPPAATFTECRTEFIQRLHDWHLTCQPNFDEGVRVTAPSSVYGVAHLHRMLARGKFDMMVTNLPPEVQKLMTESYEQLKEYVLIRLSEAQYAPAAFALGFILDPVVNVEPSGAQRAQPEPPQPNKDDVADDSEEEEIWDI